MSRHTLTFAKLAKFSPRLGTVGEGVGLHELSLRRLAAWSNDCSGSTSQRALASLPYADRPSRTTEAPADGNQRPGPAHPRAPHAAGYHPGRIIARRTADFTRMSRSQQHPAKSESPAGLRDDAPIR